MRNKKPLKLPKLKRMRHFTALISLSRPILSLYLDAKQIDAVKDGMTYGVVMVTYKATVDMIPTLKEEEKAQIMAWLVEAREFAMDAENSNKKHAAFGKYKGRINNYLSKRGYDLVKERKAWYERIKARGGKI